MHVIRVHRHTVGPAPFYGEEHDYQYHSVSGLWQYSSHRVPIRVAKVKEEDCYIGPETGFHEGCSLSFRPQKHSMNL
jgi:hypothetical protein